jgi:hypothetical protein
MAQQPGTLYAFLSGVQFTAREELIAQQRGTTAENTRHVAMSKVLDARNAVGEMLAITEDSDARAQLQGLYDALL